jgi:hypothetical protein
MRNIVDMTGQSIVVDIFASGLIAVNPLVAFNRFNNYIIFDYKVIINLNNLSANKVIHWADICTFKL